MQKETAEALIKLQSEDFCEYVLEKCPLKTRKFRSKSKTHDVLIPEFYPDRTEDPIFDNMITQLSLMRCSVRYIHTDIMYDVTAFPNKRILFIFSEKMIHQHDSTIKRYKLYGYFEYPESAFPYVNRLPTASTTIMK